MLSKESSQVDDFYSYPALLIFSSELSTDESTVSEYIVVYISWSQFDHTQTIFSLKLCI